MKTLERSPLKVRLVLLAGVLAVAGVVSWTSLRCGNDAGVSSGPEVGPLGVAERAKVALTADECAAVQREFCNILDHLARTSSQQAYDQFLPLVCECADKLMWAFLPHDWCRDLNPDLAKQPVLAMLADDDPYRHGAAAFLAGQLDIREATPLMIDLLKTRLDVTGRWAQREPLKALGRLAYHGDKTAADFLISHSKRDAWRDIPYVLDAFHMDRARSAEHMWYGVNSKLMFYPSEESIRALEDGDYPHAARKAYLIRTFLASGDSYDEFCNILYTKGSEDNKYMANCPIPPAWATSVGPGTNSEGSAGRSLLRQVLTIRQRCSFLWHGEARTNSLH